MQAAKQRYDRVKRLREMRAPPWVIKWEQVQMVLARFGYDLNMHATLTERHVTPLMGE